MSITRLTGLVSYECSLVTKKWSVNLTSEVIDVATIACAAYGRRRFPLIKANKPYILTIALLQISDIPWSIPPKFLIGGSEGSAIYKRVDGYKFCEFVGTQEEVMETLTSIDRKISELDQLSKEYMQKILSDRRSKTLEDNVPGFKPLSELGVATVNQCVKLSESIVNRISPPSLSSPQ